MQSVYNFVVTPIGQRYNNVKKIGDKELILNTENFNHEYVNRLAKVISIPKIGDTDVNVGDEVIVHHNVFRRWKNVRGIEKNSRNYIDENTYLLQPDQLFLYKQNNVWQVPKGYCWLQPIKNKNKFSIDKEQLVGIVKYTDGTVNKNSLVGFHASGQYEFVVDGQRLYRVLSNLITIEYEYQGDEEAYNPSWAQSS